MILALLPLGTGVSFSEVIPQTPEYSSPDTAFSETANKYLLVYDYYDPEMTQHTVMGQFVDIGGIPIGSAFTISNTPSIQQDTTPQVEFNSQTGYFFVVWSQDMGPFAQIFASEIDPNGNYVNGQAPTFPVFPGGGDFQRNPRLAYSNTADKFCVVWDYNTPGSPSFINGIASVLIDTSRIPIGLPMNLSQESHFPDVTFNSSSNTFVIAFTGASGNILISEYTVSNQAVVENQPIAGPVFSTDQAPRIVHNASVGDQYVTWMDPTASVLMGAYRTTPGAAQALSDAGTVEQSLGTALAVNPSGNGLVVSWIYEFIGDGSLYTLYKRSIFNDGTLDGIPQVMSSDDAAKQGIAIGNDTNSNTQLFTASYTQFMGESSILAINQAVPQSGALSFSTESTNVNEGESTQLTISRTGGSYGSVEIDVATVSDTASESDYVGTTATLVFNDGVTTQTIDLETTEDVEQESDEVFMVMLTNPVGGAVLGTYDTHYITIVDDEPATDLSFSVPEVTVLEGASIDLSIIRSGDTTGEVSVDYATVHNTTDANDYVTQSGTLTFADGVVEQTITINTVLDEVQEDEEYFSVQLSNPVGALLGVNDYIDITLNDYMYYERQSGLYHPYVAYSSIRDEYFMVYEEFDAPTRESAISGQFIDKSGSKVGEAITIAARSADWPWTPTVVYNAIDDEFLVAWTAFEGNGEVTHVTILNGDGTTKVSEFTVDSNTDQYHFIVNAVYNRALNNYCLVWGTHEFETGQEIIQGAILDSQRTLIPLSFSLTGEAVYPDVTYNQTDGTFDVVFVSGSYDGAILSSVFSGTGEPVTVNEQISELALKQYGPTITHNLSAGDDYVTWIDSSGVDEKLLGQFRNTSGIATEIAFLSGGRFGYDDLSNVPHVSDMLLVWAEQILGETTAYSVKAQRLDSDGLLTGETLIIESGDAYIEGVNVAYDNISDDYMIAYTYQPTVGDSTIETITLSQVEDSLIDDVISFVSSTSSVAENGTASIQLIRTENLTGEVIVNYLTTIGTAGEVDYTPVSGSAILADGVDTITIDIDITDDEEYEGNEEFTVSITSVENGIPGTIADHTVTILDNEEQPLDEIAFAASTSSVAEGGTASIELTRTGYRTGEVSVSFETVTGTAGESDYTPISGTAIFADGVDTAMIDVNILGDTDYEGNEVFTISLLSATGAIKGSITDHAVTILDDEEPVVILDEISFTSSSSSIEEGGIATIGLTRTGNLSGAVSVSFEMIIGTAGESDYTPVSGTAIFADGGGTAIIEVDTVDDTSVEGDEEFTVLLTGAEGAELGTTYEHTVTIIENDEPPCVIEVSLTDIDVLEGDTAVVTVQRTGSDREAVSVDYTTATDSADETDFTAVSDTLTFAIGEIEKIIEIQTVSDTDWEGDEIFTVTLSNPVGNAVISINDTATITIMNDDDPQYGVFSVSASEVQASESDMFILTVLRSGGSDGEVTVDYETVHSGYTAGPSDFTTDVGTLVFAHGVTSQTVTIYVTEDEVYEGDETFAFVLGNATGGASINQELNETVITIVDDEVPQYGEFSVSNTEVLVEESGYATVTVLRSGGADGEVSVDYATIYTEYTADDSDFTPVTETLTFADGITSQEISISITEDDLVEGDEQFALVLSNPLGGASLSQAFNSAVVTIVDDEIPQYGTFSVGASEVSASESGHASVTVLRNGGSDGEVSVDYETVYTEYAADTSDFTPTTGSLIFADGEISKTILIPITEDELVEGDEQFAMTLSNPVGGATISQLNYALITIVDDDEPPAGIVYVQNPVITVTEGQTATVELERSGGSYGEIAVAYITLTGTASQSDFTDTYGVINFADGETSKTIEILTVEDSVIENTEEFMFYISGSFTGTVTESLINITDNDVQQSSDKEDKDDKEPSTPDEPSQSESDASSNRDIENLTKSITLKLEEAPESISTDVAEAYMDVIVRNIEEIQEEEYLTEALTSYVDTMEVISEMTGDTVQNEWVEAQVIEISEVVTAAVQKIEDDTSLVEIAVNLMEELQNVETVTEIEKTVEVKNTVEDLAQSVFDKIGEVDVQSTVTVVEGISEVAFETETLEEIIAEKAANFESLTDSFDEYFGEDNVREFQFEVTLATERVGDQVQVPIDQSIIDTLNEAGVDALSVQVGGTKLTIDQEVYTSDEVAEAPQMVVDMNFADQGFVVKDESVNFKKGYVTDVRVFLDDKEQKKLEKPVQLSFDLNEFEFWEDDPSPATLSVFRQNEETGEWEAVGGVYDPVTNTVSTRRISLSQYTVMQSNKSFSDVEDSWAKDEINELLSKGILDEEVAFNPEETITRAEFTTWVARAYGVTDDAASAPFTDIPSDHENYAEIASAYNAGIVSGSGGGSFNPDATMTKEQMSAILANAMTQYDEKMLNQDLVGTLASASDGDLISDWAGDDMAMLMELGVIGTEEGNLNPQQELSKEEAAAILKKIYG